ncbi:TniQ family protein [Catenulispora subtropica]|uniref:TniQ domain-containing protein n=1 Tax=Catenulispora subtropica TaxID=450798 RepID=A0ABP5EAY6_9ACTN
MFTLSPELLLDPLPRSVKPVLNETMDSYIRRLALANFLDPQALRAHLAGDNRKRTPVPASTLAAVTGHSARTLRCALPELNIDDTGANLPITGRPHPASAKARPACRLCTAARGVSEHVQCWARSEDQVCFKHLRWLGLDSAPANQPDLSEHPRIVRAARQHAALVRTYGRSDVRAAYADAAHIARSWLEEKWCLNHVVNTLIDFHGKDWDLHRDDPTVAAALYPASIALIGVILSPWWQSLDVTGAWNLRDMFLHPFVGQIRELVRATVADDYELDIHRGGRGWDSLTSRIIVIVMMGAKPLSHSGVQRPEAFGEIITPLPPRRSYYRPGGRR